MGGGGISLPSAGPVKKSARSWFPTPREATVGLVLAHPCLKQMPVWEPMAGDAAMSACLTDMGCDVVASDIHPLDRRVGQAEYFTANPPFEGESFAIVTNPAFELADDMVWRALSHDGCRFLALLLKATFWHAAKRQAIFARHQPSVVHPLTWRLDFFGKGQPIMDCIWVVWDRQRPPGDTAYRLMSKPTVF